MAKERIAIGLSGGVDSAAAALLLREAGYEVVGLTMTLGRAGEELAVAEARAVAERLKIDFFVRDFAAEWKRLVLDYIRDTYLAGQTPNPCVRCNETVKFALLPRYAFDELGCGFFATGHYARVERVGERARLFRGRDRSKDQSYFLYRVPRDVLSRTMFPLGEMTKAEVRAYVADHGLTVADKGDSQDFCGGDPMAIVDCADRPGDIVTADGRKLGVHRGYWHYTIGMRKGLGVGGGTPFYVVRLDPLKNEVVVAPREESIGYDFGLTDIVGTVDKRLPVKVRSAGEPRLLKDGIAGIAPGQSAVFYDGDEVVGGGIISSIGASR